MDARAAAGGSDVDGPAHAGERRLRDVAFEQALNALAAAGRTFHRVVDPRVLNVLPDTPAKRREFEQQVVKTIFLSNADLKETIDLLRVVLGARRHGGCAQVLETNSSASAAPTEPRDEVESECFSRNMAVQQCQVNGSWSIEIAIIDQGCGMTAKEVEIALQPFRQIESSMVKRSEGTGLGLPLAKRLIDLHGGELLIETTPQVGTTARIRLPPARTRASQAAA